jgi:hypothetical protein
MTRIAVADALSFVSRVELPSPPALESLEAPAEFNFDAAKAQAAVVGSDIVSFVQGVTEERRRDIINSALLAQLVANRNVPDKNNILAWYEAYFDTLSNIGWVAQTKQFVEHVETSENLNAHEAILAVATTLLGPGTAALQVVMTTLDALSSMERNSPWITIFNRESQHARSARFQVTLAEQDEHGQFLVSLMAFALTADADLTQILFFKFKSNEVQIQHSSGKLTINSPVLTAVRQPVEEKLTSFASHYVRSLPDLG